MDDANGSVWASRYGIAMVRVQEECVLRDECGDDHEAIAYRYQTASGWGRLYVIAKTKFVERFERTERGNSMVDGDPSSDEAQMRGGAA